MELQTDELCAFIGSKHNTLWLFATIEVSSRLWAGSLLGRRSYRNAKAVINDIILQGRLAGFPLMTTDGFEYYFAAIERLFGSACVYVKCSRPASRAHSSSTNGSSACRLRARGSRRSSAKRWWSAPC